MGKRDRNSTFYKGLSSEETLKSHIKDDWFKNFDYETTDKVDFAIVPKGDLKKPLDERQYYLWAEAKKGVANHLESLAQMILTIGKAKMYNRYMPPAYLGTFDAEKFAFIPYHLIQEIFNANDFNWNVTPSNHNSREFLLVQKILKRYFEKNAWQKIYIFNYDNQAEELDKFIAEDFVNKISTYDSKIQIGKNNFIFIYEKWHQAVAPSIIMDWKEAKNQGIIDGDFYLADLLSKQNISLKEKLFVYLQSEKYFVNRKLNKLKMFESMETGFYDGQKAYSEFWDKYERPPHEEYWDYIIERRDLLVPQDIRERKGSFFTPQQWVELSQKYIADVLGENWQDEYTIWDCAAGTGNLLAGLTNKYNIWASTLDEADVKVMRDRAQHGANLLDSHIFKFDFLNDSFDELPLSLRAIIADPEKRKKLLVYINPPYAETATNRTFEEGRINKREVSFTRMRLKYAKSIGIATKELFAQFLIRIYCEIPGCKIGQFSKLKHLQGPNFSDFRKVFQPKLEKLFVVPADTFDNVKGQFPIGFFVWNLENKDEFVKTISDVFNEKGEFICQKTLETEKNSKSINDWIITTRNRFGETNIGYMSAKGADFQNQNYNFIINDKSQLPNPRGTQITDKNLCEITIYFAVRHCIPATWLNDRDQFLYPNDGWKDDKEFQSDCLAYTLFHSQNRITKAEGINNWIPFTESEVDARECFDSHFMTDFIKGKIKYETPENNLFSTAPTGRENDPSCNPLTTQKRPNPLTPFPHGQVEEVSLSEKSIMSQSINFSPSATAVFGAGLALWRYYHEQHDVDVNASLYDIRRHFQGVGSGGRMNNKSDDARYNKLIGNLRYALDVLAKKIEPKVYEYGFLK